MRTDNDWSVVVPQAVNGCQKHNEKERPVDKTRKDREKGKIDGKENEMRLSKEEGIYQLVNSCGTENEKERE